MLRKWLKQAKKLFYTCVLELNMQLSTAWDNQVVKIVVSSYAVNHTLYLAILYAHCASIRVNRCIEFFCYIKFHFREYRPLVLFCCFEICVHFWQLSTEIKKTNYGNSHYCSHVSSHNNTVPTETNETWYLKIKKQ